MAMADSPSDSTTVPAASQDLDCEECYDFVASFVLRYEPCPRLHGPRGDNCGPPGVSEVKVCYRCLAMYLLQMPHCIIPATEKPIESIH